MKIIVHEVNGLQIGQRREDGYINATDNLLSALTKSSTLIGIKMIGEFIVLKDLV